jgi:hypothetical protein
MPRKTSPKKEIKQIAVYGRSRIWKTRKDKVRQRYWTTTRFEIKGTGPNLYKAYKYIRDHHLVPKRRYVKVSASRFNARPYDYGKIDVDAPLPKYKPRGRSQKTGGWK